MIGCLAALCHPREAGGEFRAAWGNTCRVSILAASASTRLADKTQRSMKISGPNDGGDIMRDDKEIDCPGIPRASASLPALAEIPAPCRAMEKVDVSLEGK
jgi:hypothetical protein